MVAVAWLSGCTSEVATSQTAQQGGSNSFCGDGQVDFAEQCDDGNDDNTDDCIIDPQNNHACLLNVCGDGYVHLTGTPPFEECDDGDFGQDGDCVIDEGVAVSCKLATCGDGYLHTVHSDPQIPGSGPLEECDAAGETFFCNATCTDAACGDGVLNVSSGEECDDGNDDNSDDCIIQKPDVPPETAFGVLLLNCKLATCGDNFVHTTTTMTQGAGPVETCDDGNTEDGDDCPATCGSMCGDGFVSSTEFCDPGVGGGQTATCDADCSQVECGDGQVNIVAGEECDDGSNNTNEPNGCRPITCKRAACGDGTLDDNEECDNGSENGLDDSSECSNSCAVQGFTARSGGCENDAGGGGAGLLTAMLVVGAAVLSRRRRVVAGAVLVLGLALVPTAARADGFALTRFSPPPSFDDGLTVILPTTLEEQKISAMITFDLSDRPLVLKNPNSSNEVNIVRKALGAHADFAYGVSERFELHADLPVSLAQSGDSSALGSMTFESGSAAVGDGRVGFVVDARGDRHSAGIGIGGAVDVVFPIGSQDDFAGDGDVGIDMHFLGSYTLPNTVIFALDTGLIVRPRNDFVDVRFGAELAANAGVHVPVTPHLRVLAEVDAAVPLRSQNDGLPVPLETLAGVRYQLGPWVLGAAGGAGLTDAVGTPTWRAVVTFGWTNQGSERAWDPSTVAAR